MFKPTRRITVLEEWHMQMDADWNEQINEALVRPSYDKKRRTSGVAPPLPNDCDRMQQSAGDPQKV
ncbi:MAG TPA: hypothetical protein VNA16_11440, partial [Abditibacteriaceae bacterium]|nr:hypothetical protein [Abditibacteriaceae bacterium]